MFIYQRVPLAIMLYVPVISMFFMKYQVHTAMDIIYPEILWLRNPPPKGWLKLYPKIMRSNTYQIYQLPSGKLT